MVTAWALGVALVSPVAVYAESAELNLVLPETRPVELADTVEGKLEQAERALKAREFEHAYKAGVEALNQAIAELPKVGSPSRQKAEQKIVPILRLLTNLGNQALEANDLAVAQVSYGEVLKVSPNSSEAILGRAEVSRLAGRVWEGFQLYSDYLKRDDRPRDGRAELGMGLVCLELRKFPLAVPYLEEAVRVAPNNAEAVMGLARAYFGKDLYKKAVPYANKAIDLDKAAPLEKQHPEYRYWQARILRSAGQLDTAITVAREYVDWVTSALRATPGDIEMINHLDDALGLQYELLQARLDTDQGRRDPRVRLEMARIVERQGVVSQVRSYVRALELLKVLHEEQPDNVDVLLQVGRLARLLNKGQDAIQAYQRVLEISSGNEQAKTALREMGAPLRAPKPATTTTATTTTTTTSSVSK